MATENPNADLENALKLEEARLAQFIYQEVMTKATDKGLLKQHLKADDALELFSAILQSAFDRALALRKELGIRVPALLTTPNLESLDHKLSRVFRNLADDVQFKI